MLIHMNTLISWWFRIMFHNRWTHLINVNFIIFEKSKRFICWRHWCRIGRIRDILLVKTKHFIFIRCVKAAVNVFNWNTRRTKKWRKFAIVIYRSMEHICIWLLQRTILGIMMVLKFISRSLTSIMFMNVIGNTCKWYLCLTHLILAYIGVM